jgi:RNA polymerase sigma factor (TIGR02999 family)
VREDVTALLIAHGQGEREAFERLVPLVYQDLRRVARARLRGQGSGETLNTTALVHEAYVKLVDQSRVSWNDRQHFFAVAAMAMRQILIDHARHRGRDKRGGQVQKITLDEAPDPTAKDSEQLIDLDLALSKLAEIDERQVRIVECRYFAGLTEQETADALGLSLRTTQREWLKARAWLRHELERAGPGGLE